MPHPDLRKSCQIVHEAVLRAYAVCALIFVRGMGTEDFRTGVQAFYARQTPTFQAR